MADKWNGIIENGQPGHSAIIDVNVWFGKATLDACVLALALGVRGLRTNPEPTSKRIGAGAFEYDFGVLEDADNPLAKSYTDIMCGLPSPSSVVPCFHRVNRPPCLLVLHPSGTLLDYTFSSWPSRGGSRDLSHGSTKTPIALECRGSEGTRTRGAVSLRNCSIRRDKS